MAQSPPVPKWSRDVYKRQINTLLDIIPFLGSAGRFLVSVVMFPIAFILSVVTILISIIAHSPILLTLVFVAMGAGGYFLYQKKKKKAA